jgi:aminomethyltransferase
MPVPSPFHPRTSKLCTSLFWKDWAGYHAVRSYDTYMEREYFAFRHTAGLIDVTPLYKYEVQGPDAAAFLSRVMVRNIAKLQVGQVAYTCWCDDAGKMVDDGTVSRLDQTHFRVTAAEPSLAWFQRYTRAYDVTVRDSSRDLAAVSLQGPTSRDILKQVTDAPVDSLKFFRLVQTKVDGLDAIISRTGYTGDLGFEVWVKNADALALWDALAAAGKPYGMVPAGLDAMDVTRVEAGFIMNGVDYYSANHCLIESRKSTPYEMALGWTVHLKRDPFIGQAALIAEKEAGPGRFFVGLSLDWDGFAAHFARHNLPPEVPSGAWRDPRPVYARNGSQVGYATSGAWSPVLKKNLALATVRAGNEAVGTELDLEVTVEYERKRVRATVETKPFFNPERKKS